MGSISLQKNMKKQKKKRLRRARWLNKKSKKNDFYINKPHFMKKKKASGARTGAKQNLIKKYKM